MEFLSALNSQMPEWSLLLSGAFLIAWRKLFSESKPWENFLVAFGCWAVVAALLLVRAFGFADFHIPESTPTFNGWMRADHYARFFQLLLMFVFGVRLLLSPIRPISRSGFAANHSRAVFFFSVASGCFALSSFHLFLSVLLLEAMILGFRSASAIDNDQANPSSSPSSQLLAKSNLLGSALLFGGALLLSGFYGGFTYKAASVGITQSWSEGTPVGAIISWALLSIGILLKGRGALKYALDAKSRDLEILSAVATPLVLLGVWFRLSAAIFAGLVQNSLIANADGTLLFIQGLILLAAFGCMAFGLVSVRNAKGPMATLQAAIPIQMGICIACAFGLDQDAAIASSAFATSVVVATLGAIVGLRAIYALPTNGNGAALKGIGSKRAWLTLGWAVALFSLAGFPPTFGFAVRWGMLSTLMSGQHISLMVFVSFASVVLISAYFSMLRLVFLSAPSETISTQDSELRNGQSFQVKDSS